MTIRLSIFVAVTFLAGLGFLWQAAQFPASHEVSTLIGPRTWPFGVLVLMLGLLAVMALLLWTKGPEPFTGSQDASSPASEPDAAVQRDHLAGGRWRHLIILGLTLGYTLTMTLTGYLVATALFAALATVVLGERRPLRVGLNTAIAVAIVALVFDRLLNIPLP
ncbi:tripartite tricarboxylate transporter TctB family protein [Salipiger bermudensis]|uniref:tripartite tricarboxylate transporter TctB family protein n=1 Tax=Salipiger bermudensis TaxID=344736 RepID=UPI001C99891F|nr:tripartite tricarboxylate transporter TctB family protein [Salipiger bermudensis]MBY6006149.1 tripartite tricarboxylate transporter TctB family protein [Salipiger bermudensis]